MGLSSLGAGFAMGLAGSGRRASAGGVPERGVPERGAPERGAPERRALRGEAPERAASLGGTAEQGGRERVALWAADRAGHALYGLGADGAVLRRIEVDAPLEVRASPGPGCLVLSALDRHRAGPSRWLEWTGERLRDVSEGSRPQAGATESAFQRPSSEALTVRTEAGGNGAWVLRGPTGPRPVDPSLLERWDRVARARGGWVQRSSSPLPFAARALAPIDGGVWVAGYRVAVALKVARSGAVLREVALEGADGVEDALAIPPGLGGGVWLAACGALVRLDGRGRRRPGQGGFAHLVSLAAGSPP